MEKLAMFPVLALGLGLALNALNFGGPEAQAQAQAAQRVAEAQPADDEVPPDIIAVQVRKQGYACNNPSKAKRDASASRPDLPVWILTCENATYSVRLVGNMADRIEKQ